MDCIYKNPNEPIEARVKELLSRLSLKQKVGQMTQIERRVATSSSATTDFSIEEKEGKLLQAKTTSGNEVSYGISSSPPQDPETTGGNEITLPSSPSQDPETTRRNEGKFLSVMKIMDEQDMGKHLLGLAIPMAVTLVLSPSSLVQTTEMKIVLISLSLAVALICNGLLLRKTVTKMSTVMLLLGYSLMLLSFFSLIGLFLPANLKWIPLLCWLAALIPFVMYGYWAYFRQDEQDPERGE